jgi:hypothetical protein
LHNGGGDDEMENWSMMYGCSSLFIEVYY